MLLREGTLKSTISRQPDFVKSLSIYLCKKKPRRREHVCQIGHSKSQAALQVGQQVGEEQIGLAGSPAEASDSLPPPPTPGLRHDGNPAKKKT